MKTITLAIVAALAASGCVQYRKDTPGSSMGGFMSPDQARGLEADANTTDVQKLGIITGTPMATATEAQQMMSGSAWYGGYGYPYGAAGVYGYGAGATIVPPSYYMSGAGTTTIPPLPEGGIGGVGASLPTSIQPIIVPMQGGANAAILNALNLNLNATGQMIELGDMLAAGQKYQTDLALYRVCLYTHKASDCTPPVAPQAESDE